MNFEIDRKHKTVVSIEFLYSALLHESGVHLFTDESERFSAVNGSFKRKDGIYSIDSWLERRHQKRACSEARS